MLAQQYYQYPHIEKQKKHLFGLDMVDYIIARTFKFLVVTITGL